MLKLKNRYGHNIILVPIDDNKYKIDIDQKCHFVRTGFDVINIKAITFIDFEGGPMISVGDEVVNITKKVTEFEGGEEENIIEYFIEFNGNIPKEYLEESK